MISPNAIEELRKKFNAAAAKNVTANYLISVRGEGGGVWLTKIDDGKCEFIEQRGDNVADQADCRITVSAEDLQMIMDGRMSAMTAALSGMLAIEGELGLAMQLVPMFFDGQSSIF